MSVTPSVWPREKLFGPSSFSLSVSRQWFSLLSSSSSSLLSIRSLDDKDSNSWLFPWMNGERRWTARNVCDRDKQTKVIAWSNQQSLDLSLSTCLMISHPLLVTAHLPDEGFSVLYKSFLTCQARCVSSLFSWKSCKTALPNSFLWIRSLEFNVSFVSGSFLSKVVNDNTSVWWSISYFQLWLVTVTGQEQ